MAEKRYPEHEKLEAVSGERDTVAEFLEWLENEGMTVARWHEAGDNGRPMWLDTWNEDEPITDEEKQRRSKEGKHHRSATAFERTSRFDYNPWHESWDAGFYPEPLKIEKLLAAHYGIDTEKLSQEKGEMLEALRQSNSARTAARGEEKA